MKPVPGTLHDGGAPFQTTHWTVVLLAAQSQSAETAQEALKSFCQDYWPPLYTFLRRRGHPPADAQDLAQACFVHLLEQNTLARASREKGRLRTFLLGSLQNFLVNEHDRATALKRGGGTKIVSMDDQLIDAEAAVLTAGRDDEANGYDRAWAKTLFSQAWDRLHGTMVGEGKKELIEAIQPFVAGGTSAPPDQEKVAEKLRMPISTFRNALRRLRQRYRDDLRAEVARTVSDSSEIDEELRYLLRLLLP